VLHVITNSLEFANFSIVEDIVDDSINSSLNFLKVNGPEVFVHLLLDSPSSSVSWDHRVTEAFSGDDLRVGLVESLNESTIDVF